MFKIFWSASVKPRNQLVQDWRHDPLGHPALLAMNQLALADLPMVAEVPVRMSTVQVADDGRRRADVGLVAGCAVSR